MNNNYCITEMNSKIMQNIPNNYERSLEYFMKIKHMTEEELAFASALSVKTISRHRVYGTRMNPKITTIIQIIIGLKLQPPFSEHLLRQAGYILKIVKSMKHIDVKLFNKMIDKMWISFLYVF